MNYKPARYISEVGKDGRRWRDAIDVDGEEEQHQQLDAKGGKVSVLYSFLDEQGGKVCVSYSFLDDQGGKTHEMFLVIIHLLWKHMWI